MTFDSNDIESHREIRKAIIPCDDHGCCQNDFALFMLTDGMVGGGRKSGRYSVTNFNKCQALLIEHDEIDLATTAMKISSD